MTIKSKLGATKVFDDERAQCGGHGPVISTCKLKADQGELPVGLILSEDADGLAVPYREVAEETVGTGTGELKNFSATLAQHPIRKGSVAVTDGVETFADDGCGHLTGSAGGTGQVNYKTGAIAVSFNANVVDDVVVEAAYATAILGVLDEAVDTAESTAGNYIPHGSVRRDVLKVGASSPAAPSQALLMLLCYLGIYPS